MSSDESLRTPEQKQALREAFMVLAAQFDNVLIVACSEADVEAMGTDLEVYWKGSWLMANSLADYAKHKINYQRRHTRKPGAG